ncbi:DUF1353 domain-containing protein [Pseudomonas mandelii]|uniref:DUF1353 domain-containing protein n=1 Tax=Pseudomonas mandelii TaxID=75612 RepID=UPI000373652D
MLIPYRPIRFSLLIVSTLLASCATPTPPSVARLGDGVFVVSIPLGYQLMNTNYKIRVPRGFITDLASIPQTLWWWESPIDRTMAPAIIHDFLYWDQGCTKDEADAVLSIGMFESGVTPATRNLVYAGVRTPLGDKAFKDNAAAKARGESHYLTSRYTGFLLGRPAVPDDDLQSILARAKLEHGVSPSGTNYKAQTKQVCKAALALLRNNS